MIARVLMLIALVLPCSALAQGVPDALQSLRPGAEWSCRGTAYTDCTWLDQVQTKPTEQEVNDEIARLAAAKAAEDQRLGNIEEDADLKDLLAKLRTMTPAEWKAHVDGISNLAQARAMFYRMGLALMLLARALP